MNKILLVPDSFKGSMSSIKICSVMEKAIASQMPKCEVVSLPVADGGEGSVEAFVAAMGGKVVDKTVPGPFGEPLTAFYGLVGDTAIIEMAAAAGLPLVGEHKDPLNTTTYGVGKLMMEALADGAKKLIVCLGGSATNDGGTGAACACGVKFFDANGERFVPVGGTLERITKIDLSTLQPEIKSAQIITICDIINPLFGENGAAYAFAPQKGADENEVLLLDRGLRCLAERIRTDLGIDVSELPGGGAAGGMGAGMYAFFTSELRSGIESVLDAVNFEEHLDGADLVITGEGKLDSQSLGGKVVLGVARRAKAKNVPVVAVVGDIGDDIGAVYGNGISGVFSINRIAAPFEQLRPRAEDDLFLTVENLMRFIKSFI